jgi:hypothetical protein
MKPGSSMEEDVHYVYHQLLNMRDEGVVVGKSVFMVGKSGCQNEIDVYYEFLRAGIRHRVAIECKDWGTPVSKGRVHEFESKIRDIGTVTGVIVSRNGYQSGAEAFARHHDILPLLFDELPAMNVLMAERIRAVALPDKDYVGEPFWTIMEVQDGEVTGSHYAASDSNSGKRYVPLTFSKPLAERLFIQHGLDPQKWAVRGLPRFAFRAFLIILEHYEKRMDGGAVICFPPAPQDGPNAQFVAMRISREELMHEYYGEVIPSVE